MADVTNILVGAVNVYVAPVGTAPPDEDDNPLVWTGWTNVGYTDGGVELEYSPDYSDHFVDQETGPVKTTLTQESATLRAPMAEATLQNLNRVISASSFSQVVAASGVTGKDILKVGSGTPAEVAVGFEGKSPENFWRLFIGWRALVVGAVGQAYRKDEKLIFPAEYRLNVDSTKTAGERLFRMVDMTAAAL